MVIKTMINQRGFALIEVIIAALVMIIGGVAYMRLQQQGLRYSHNNYVRVQGVAIVQSFVEQLRSNRGYVRFNNKLSGEIKPLDYLDSTRTDVSPCDSSDSSCNESLFKFQEHLISKQIAEVSRNSILCYQERDKTKGFIRITYIWQDNSQLGNNVNLSCGSVGFNDDIQQNNSVTIYAQL